MLLLAAYLLQDRRPDTLRANECTQTFQTSSSNTERMQALECLFTLGKPQFNTRALELFYSLDQTEQRRFFRVEDLATVANALFVVAGKVAPTLPDIITADDSGDDYDQEILESMADALDRLGRSDAKALGSQLRRWINGRQAAGEGGAGHRWADLPVG